MGKKSKPQTQTKVQKADPWVGVQPNLLELYGSSGDWFRRGNTVAPNNWNLAHSQNMIRDRALSGSPLMGQAKGTAQWHAAGNAGLDNPVLTGQMQNENRWARGDMMGGNPAASIHNPYVSELVDAATRDVKDDFMESIAPALASQFAAAGRGGSGAHMAAFSGAAGKLAGRLGDISSNIRGQAFENATQRQFNAYENDLQRMFGAHEAEAGARRQGWLAQPGLQLQAAAMLPQLAQMDYMDADRLQGVGQMQRGMEQEFMDEPLKRLQAYSALLQGASGYGTTTGSGSQATPYNRVAGTLGGALTGGMVGPMLGMTGPIGAILGAGLGLFG